MNASACQPVGRNQKSPTSLNTTFAVYLFPSGNSALAVQKKLRLKITISRVGVMVSGVVVSGVRRMNEVNARRARLAPGWATVFGLVYHLGM